MTRCVIVGAGAQGRVVLETWRASVPDASFAFVDDAPRLHGTEILGVEVVGPVVVDGGDQVVVALGDNRRRLQVARELASRGARFATPVHPSAVVSPTATIGEGTVVLPGAIVHTGARVGEHVIVNSGAIIEHDCEIGDAASISPGARMGGRARVGARAFLSTGVTLGARASVGDDAVIGAGAVVVGEIPDASLAFGVPARVRRALAPDEDLRRLL